MSLAVVLTAAVRIMSVAMRRVMRLASRRISMMAMTTAMTTMTATARAIMMAILMAALMASGMTIKCWDPVDKGVSYLYQPNFTSARRVSSSNSSFIFSFD